MDQLTIMRSFVGVTKSRSFSQAARQLGISGSLVSRHVAELERATGVRLVNRTARTISLTEAGAPYAEFAARILDDIDRDPPRRRRPGRRDAGERDPCLPGTGPAAVRASLTRRPDAGPGLAVP